MCQKHERAFKKEIPKITTKEKISFRIYLKENLREIMLIIIGTHIYMHIIK